MTKSMSVGCDACSETKQIVTFIAHQLVGILEALNIKRCICGSCETCILLMKRGGGDSFLDNTDTTACYAQTGYTGVIQAARPEIGVEKNWFFGRQDSDKAERESVACHTSPEEDDIATHHSPPDLDLRWNSDAPQKTQAISDMEVTPFYDSCRVDSPNTVIKCAIAGASKRKMRHPERTDLSSEIFSPIPAASAQCQPGFQEAGGSAFQTFAKSNFSLRTDAIEEAFAENGGKSAEAVDSPSIAGFLQKSVKMESGDRHGGSSIPLKTFGVSTSNGDAHSSVDLSNAQPRAMGSSVDGAGSKGPSSVFPTAVDTARRNGTQIKLWQFLLDLLDDNRYYDVICWTNREKGEFKLLNADCVSQLWGRYKDRPFMNYEKMSRILRYYYKKNIMCKVRGQAYVYRFLATDPLLLEQWDRSASVLLAKVPGLLVDESEFALPVASLSPNNLLYGDRGSGPLLTEDMILGVDKSRPDKSCEAGSHSEYPIKSDRLHQDIHTDLKRPKTDNCDRREKDDPSSHMRNIIPGN